MMVQAQSEGNENLSQGGKRSSFVMSIMWDLDGSNRDRRVLCPKFTAWEDNSRTLEASHRASSSHF